MPYQGGGGGFEALDRAIRDPPCVEDAPTQAATALVQLYRVVNACGLACGRVGRRVGRHAGASAQAERWCAGRSVGRTVGCATGRCTTLSRLRVCV